MAEQGGAGAGAAGGPAGGAEGGGAAGGAEGGGAAGAGGALANPTSVCVCVPRGFRHGDAGRPVLGLPQGSTPPPFNRGSRARPHTASAPIPNPAARTPLPQSSHPGPHNSREEQYVVPHIVPYIVMDAI